MNEIETEEYKARYDVNSNSVILEGVYRLQGLSEYKPISELLTQSISVNNEKTLTLDIKKLTFLNSSGIAVLSRFVIEVRKTEGKDLIIKGSKDIPWQEKSLNNLKRLMPDLVLNLV